jgi:hypothetical protein
MNSILTPQSEANKKAERWQRLLVFGKRVTLILPGVAFIAVLVGEYGWRSGWAWPHNFFNDEFTYACHDIFLMLPTIFGGLITAAIVLVALKYLTTRKS